MLTYILTFISGGVVFVSLLLWHQYSVKRATERLREEYHTRRENARLRAENEELRGIVDARERCDEARDAARSSGCKSARTRAPMTSSPEP